MKKSLVLLTLACVLVSLVSLVACKKEETIAEEPTQPATTKLPPPDATPQAIGLVEAESRGYVGYEWAGRGDNATMGLTVTNKTEREWEVEIEVGTKLEAGNENVQSMVVTKEVHITLHPHDKQDIEVHAACLDISKDPPATTDASWSVQVVPRLADFIGCAERLAPADDATLRPYFVQYSLWQARGATRQQWVDFFMHYSDPPKSQAEAEQAADDQSQQFEDVVRQCPQIQ